VDGTAALTVRRLSEKEDLPAAETQAAVFENCQGWSIRVIRKLVDRGMVKVSWVGEFGEKLKEPVK
jgi:hypothetical protein